MITAEEVGAIAGAEDVDAAGAVPGTDLGTAPGSADAAGPGPGPDLVDVEIVEMTQGTGDVTGLVPAADHKHLSSEYGEK